jgi:hypothetical protein
VTTRLGSNRLTISLIVLFAVLTGTEAFAYCNYGSLWCFQNGVGTMCSQYCDSYSIEFVNFDYGCSTGFCKREYCHWYAFVQEVGGDCVNCIQDYLEACVSWA